MIEGLFLNFTLKVFVLTFKVMQEKGLIRKLRLISKYMTTQADLLDSESPI